MLSALLLKAHLKLSAEGFESTLHSISACSPFPIPYTRFSPVLQSGLSVRKNCNKSFILRYRTELNVRILFSRESGIKIVTGVRDCVTIFTDFCSIKFPAFNLISIRETRTFLIFISIRCCMCCKSRRHSSK